MCIKLCVLKLVNLCLLWSEHFLVGNLLEYYGKGVQELASLLNVSFVIELHTMCLFFFGFCQDECRNDLRIGPKRVSPWHLSIMSTKSKDNGNLFNRNSEILGSKTWSWPSNFMKIILGNVDEISNVYPELSLMTWWCVVVVFGNW